jgi:dihydroorotate dehydrogenase
MSPAIWRACRKLAFQFEAEKAHHFFAGALGFFGSFALGRAFLRILSGARAELATAPVTVGGLRFRNPIGLAAGFDKSGTLIRALPSLGFGFVEVGTVTPLPQPGNAKPRLFRDPERFTLFNRMGFNSPGAREVAKNVARARNSGALPADFRIGVNLGKNKATSAEAAHEDYRAAVAPFEGLADYFVVNVSSPNTPGLRDLQAIPALLRIVGAVREEVAKWKTRPPVYLKLAPELSGDELEALIREEARIGIEGWVLTNTLGGFWKGGRGGWSGGALGLLPRDRLERVRSRSRLPILSVGGILEAREVRERLSRGADLVQVYTGWIYFGPGWIPHLLRKLREAPLAALSSKRR